MPEAAAGGARARTPGRRVFAVALATAAACGVLSPEEQHLRRFFEASRLHDTTAAARLSRVTFNPRTDGIVEEFAVRRVVVQGAAKQVTVAAEIRQPDGRVSSRTLAITMRRHEDRWLIADLAFSP